jgi:hypothetical protein
MLTLRLAVAAAALVGLSTAAHAACSSGFISNVLCETGVIDDETSETLDDWNHQLGRPVDNAIYNGMDYFYPGAGTAARTWAEMRDSAPSYGPGPVGPSPGPTSPPFVSHQPYPQPYQPYYPQTASVCVTSMGSVPMRVPVAVGSPCYAATGYGNIPGVAQ